MLDCIRKVYIFLHFIARNLKKYRNKLKQVFQIIFKFIFMIVTLCGLIYQGKIIFTQYMSGKTIITLQIGKIPDDSSPAITICYFELFSMERAAKFYPDNFSKINEQYQELIEKDNDKAQQLYQDTFEEYTLKQLMNKGLDMNELFHKMSVKFKSLDGNDTMRLSFFGRKVNTNLTDKLNLLVRLLSGEKIQKIMKKINVSLSLVTLKKNGDISNLN